MTDEWLAITTLLVVFNVMIAALASFSCWCESLRCDRYREWMDEECDRADLAEEEIARLRLTDEEWTLIEKLTWPHPDPRMGRPLLVTPCERDVAAALLARLGGGHE